MYIPLGELNLNFGQLVLVLITNFLGQVSTSLCSFLYM